MKKVIGIVSEGPTDYLVLYISAFFGEGCGVLEYGCRKVQIRRDFGAGD